METELTSTKIPVESKLVIDPFEKLEQSVEVTLETYSNVHRGSGHNSMVTTHLFEKAREVVLQYLGLDKSKYTVVFCTPRRAKILEDIFVNGSYEVLSSQDFGIPLGVRAIAIGKKALPKGVPFQTGGGNARLVSPDKVTWANGAERFEPGTPAIINIIAFAKALQLSKKIGKYAFHTWHGDRMDATDILYEDKLSSLTGKPLLSELKKTLIGKNILVPTIQGNKPFINFDNGASTPTFLPVWESVRQTWHQPEDVQGEIISEVRSICANALGAPDTNYDVIFTSNTTEATNLVSESLNRIREPEIRPVVLNTLLEHNSNELPWRKNEGFSTVQAPIDDEGFIDLEKFESILREYNQDKKFDNCRIKLVAVTGASNVLGVFNNMQEICQIAHKYNTPVLVDAAQMIAHRKVDMERWGIDYLVFSAHKVYAPFGTGVLIARQGLLNFSNQELETINSSGEENVGGIAALGKALLLLQRIGLEIILQEEQQLTARALRGITKIPKIRVYGINDAASPRFALKGGVIIFNHKSYMPNIIANELAKRSGIGVRSGCHCAHMLIKHILHIPKPLQRFQHMILYLFPKLSLPGMVRISFGIENTEEEVDTFVNVLSDISGKLKSEVDIKGQMKAFMNDISEKVYGN